MGISAANSQPIASVPPSSAACVGKAFQMLVEVLLVIAAHAR